MAKKDVVAAVASPSSSSSSSGMAPLLPDESHTWVIHGEAYDMRGFARQHPGGAQALALGAGRDCTALFESYHALSRKRPQTILAKFKVNRPEVVNKLKQWRWAAADPFYDEVRDEVRAFLDVNNMTHKASTNRWAWFWAAFVGHLLAIYFFVQGYWWSVVVTPVYMWVFAVNYFHDASHFALSRLPWVNTVVMYLFPYFESPTTWAHQHIIGHHAYTNMDQDPDVMDRFKERRSIWRYSYFYWPLYTFMGCFVFDFAFFCLEPFKYKEKVPMAQSVFNFFRYASHLFGRMLTFYCLFFIPFQLFEGTKAYIFAIVPVMIFSTCFAAMTQISHMTPETYGNRNAKTPSWAAHEVLTTQNVATESKFWFIFSGALNLQIEHHLFPGMCSEHFPAISHIVRRVCKKHDVPYQESGGYIEAFAKHRDLLATCTIGSVWNPFYSPS